MVEDHHDPLGITDGQADALLEHLGRQVAAEVVEDEAVDVRDDDVAGLDRVPPAGAGDDAFDERHSSRGSAISPRTADAAATAGLDR
jgi:hypothetical protein